MVANNAFSDTVGGTVSLWVGGAAVTGNTINHSRGTAIEVNSDGNLISGNVLSDFETGISVVGASNNVVGNALGWGRGVAIDVSGAGSLIGSNVISDSFHGIRIRGVSNNQVLSNTLSNGQKGIVLSHASANTVSYNQLTGLTDDPSTGVKGEAIVLFDSGGNTIVGNTLANSSSGAVLESNATNNILFHNNFVDNVIQVWDYCTGNQWDNGSEGNYWSDYAGSDGDGDGIGDTPYAISPDEVDRYPLMAPYGDIHPLVKPAGLVPTSRFLDAQSAPSTKNREPLGAPCLISRQAISTWATSQWPRPCAPAPFGCSPPNSRRTGAGSPLRTPRRMCRKALPPLPRSADNPPAPCSSSLSR